jgi:ATP synthase protein I
VHFGPFLNIESQVDRIIVIQIFTVILATGIFLMFGVVAAYSVMLGGLICILPGYFAARVLVAKKGPLENLPTDVGLSPVIRSELIKFGLSVALFLATFLLVERLNTLLFFAAFIGLQLIYIVVPAIEASALRRRYAGKQSD